MSYPTNAVIIGAGVIGSAVAFEMSKRGHQVTVVEKHPAAGYGSTSNSCSIVRFHYSTYDGVALAHESAQAWFNWSEYLGVNDEAGLPEYVQCGSLILKSAIRDYDKYRRQFDDIGVAYQELNVEELRSRYPFIDLGDHGPPRSPDDPLFHREPDADLVGAIFTPEAGYVTDPQLATHNLMVAAQAHGAEFRFNTEVTAITRSEGKVSGVSLADGQHLDASVVVNVSGPHSSIINTMAGVTEDMAITTRALRHEVHHVPSPSGLDFNQVGTTISDSGNGVYCRPEVANHILVGGEDPACDPKTWVDDPDNYNRMLTRKSFNSHLFRMAKRMPELPIPDHMKGIVDLYDVTDDWIPIYDKSSLPGFYMAVGTSGNQFKNAPGAGFMMTRLIEAVEGGQDHDHDPVQVTMPSTGLTLNVGFYSRNREVNPNSTFTVLG